MDLPQFPPATACCSRPLRLAALDPPTQGSAALQRHLEPLQLGAYAGLLEKHGVSDVETLGLLIAADFEAMGITPRLGERLSQSTVAKTPVPPPIKASQPPPVVSRAPPQPVPSSRVTPPPQQQRVKKPPAAVSSAGSAGFVFLCDKRTREEVFERKLFGLGKGMIGKMREHIHPTTALFLMDFTRCELHGPFKAVSEPKFDIVAEAWGGRFGAQIRFSALVESSETLRNGVGTVTISKREVQAGPINAAKKDELLNRLLA